MGWKGPRATTKTVLKPVNQVAKLGNMQNEDFWRKKSWNKNRPTSSWHISQLYQALDKFHQLSAVQTKALTNCYLLQDNTLTRPESEKKFHPPAAQELWVDSKKGHEKGKHSPSIGLSPLLMKKVGVALQCKQPKENLKKGVYTKNCWCMNSDNPCGQDRKKRQLCKVLIPLKDSIFSNTFVG